MEKVPGLGNNVMALIGEVNGKLSGIVNIDGTEYFDTFTAENKVWSNTGLQTVPEGFPHQKFMRPARPTVTEQPRPISWGQTGTRLTPPFPGVLKMVNFG